MAAEGAARGAPNVLLVSAEVFPFSKTGGLGDATAALVHALREAGVDARAISPAYRGSLDRFGPGRRVLGFDGGHIRAVEDAEGAVHYLVEAPAAFDRPGGPYQSPERQDWPDNARRFALFQQAALALAEAGDEAWRPDVLHCNDWHAGLLPAWSRLPSLFTIHNAVFQGLFPEGDAPALGVAPDMAARIRLHGRLSMAKAGCVFADRVNVVSPRFAEEILKPEFGCGLEAALAGRPEGIAGVLNPLDAALWSPASDPLLPARFDADDLSGKAACKLAAQRRFGLPEDGEACLVAVVSRVTHQKMSDVVAAAVPDLLALSPRLQIALCGEGETAMEERLRAAATANPRFRPILAYDETTAHLAIAGADMLLHPSRFEPCGLTPIYAKRYGAVPVATRVGGHVDSIHDGEDGFLFQGERAADITAAVARALARRRDAAGWRTLVRRGMTAPTGAATAAARYLDLYREAIQSPHPSWRRPA